MQYLLLESMTLAIQKLPLLVSARPTVFLQKCDCERYIGGKYNRSKVTPGATHQGYGVLFYACGIFHNDGNNWSVDLFFTCVTLGRLDKETLERYHPELPVKAHNKISTRQCTKRQGLNIWVNAGLSLHVHQRACFDYVSSSWGWEMCVISKSPLETMDFLRDLDYVLFTRNVSFSWVLFLRSG